MKTTIRRDGSSAPTWSEAMTPLTTPQIIAAYEHGADIESIRHLAVARYAAPLEDLAPRQAIAAGRLLDGVRRAQISVADAAQAIADLRRAWEAEDPLTRPAFGHLVGAWLQEAIERGDQRTFSTRNRRRARRAAMVEAGR